MTFSYLIAEYPGDRAWSEFARAYDSKDDSIESVLTAILGSEGTVWLQSSIPALGGQIPSQILDGSWSGKRTIRSLIMRFP